MIMVIGPLFSGQCTQWALDHVSLGSYSYQAKIIWRETYDHVSFVSGLMHTMHCLQTMYVSPHILIRTR